MLFCCILTVISRIVSSSQTLITPIENEIQALNSAEKTFNAFKKVLQLYLNMSLIQY